jgi:hypothetical protein
MTDPFRIARVKTTSPLQVTLDQDTALIPARNEVTGYTPAVNDTVFVGFVAGKLYIFFKAV